MHRVVGCRTCATQDAPLAAGIDQPAGDLSLELLDRHVVGAGGDEEEAFRLDQRGGEETGKGADEDFLEEGGVHPCFNSSDSASGEGLYKLSISMFPIAINPAL